MYCIYNNKKEIIEVGIKMRNLVDYIRDFIKNMKEISILIHDENFDKLINFKVVKVLVQKVYTGIIIYTIEIVDLIVDN